MFEKTLKLFLGLQIILTASAELGEESSPHFVRNISSNEADRDISNTEQLNAGVDEDKQLNDDDSNILQLSRAVEEDVEINRTEEKNVQKLSDADEEHINLSGAGEENEEVLLSDEQPETKDIPKQLKKKQKNYKRMEKFTSWSFKYAENKNDEPGFDLSPTEMNKFKIWKDGVIPYYIDVVSFSDKVLRDKIRIFLQMVNSVTSVNFVEIPGPPSNDNDRWVFFMNRRGLLGCADHTVKNFTNQGVQRVVLGYDCIATRGEIAEAVMSILGIPAQHNAPDRDKYIKVNIDNILAAKQYLFEKLNDDEWLFHDLAYDFDSVTHYDIHKYSANGRATIEPKKASKDLNPATVFSSIDLQKIKMLYNFIVRKKKMQTPVCKKLFKISSKHKQDLIKSFKPIRPRNKPSRYTIASSAAGESNEKHEAESPDQRNDVVEKKKRNGDKKMHSMTLLKHRGKNDRIIQKILEDREKNKHNTTIDLLLQLSDYKSDEKGRQK